MYVDFSLLKQSVTILEVATMLSLPVKANGETARCPCPACGTDERALALNTKTNTFYCFKAKIGGDIIALCAHIRQLPMKEAAVYISEHIEERDFQPLDYLEEGHEAVKELGLSRATASAVGIGYAKKGIMRGHVAFPIRLSDGTLLGYLGIPPKTDVKLPKNMEVKYERQ